MTRRLLLIVALLCCQTALAQNTPGRLGDLQRREWKVDEVDREALLHLPANSKTQALPVVFAFHGHSGTMNQAARSFQYHRHWPEAIVVYMQGLKTPGRITDPEGKQFGWQHDKGDQGDRDLKFFDAVLASLKQDYKVDEDRIYVTGHSNGGSFTYLLWANRGEVFAAVAPSASAPPKDARTKLKPKPVLHVAGENDKLVKYEWQKLTIDLLRRMNHCQADGEKWEPHCVRYPSPDGFPVVTFITDGGHQFPPDAAPTIVKFFKEHRRAAAKRD